MEPRGLLYFFRKLALNANFHVAATLGVGDVGNACFAADVDPEFEGDFADFRDRHVLECPQRMGSVGPDRAFNRLKGLWKLLLRIREYASTTGVVAFNWICGDNQVGNWTGAFDRFDVNGGSVFKDNWGQLSH